MTRLTLPFPPSVNGYWRSFRGRNILSKRGREYQKAAGHALTLQTLPNFGPDTRLHITLILHAPTRAKRDVDNYLKAPLDVLTKAGIWGDDEQIDSLTVRRGEVIKGGRIEVEVTPL